jgi:uncharacterized membrane protein HdeD (DUF308 family)
LFKPALTLYCRTSDILPQAARAIRSCFAVSEATRGVCPITRISEIAMAENKQTATHPAWEDVLGIGLGVLIVLTPMLVTETVSETVQLATTFVGLLIVLLAIAERIQVLGDAKERSREWEEVLEAAFGAALIGLPFVFGYSEAGTLRYWHYALGGIVLLLAVIELRRDYVSDVASHGEPQTMDFTAWGAVGASMGLTLAVSVAAYLMTK